MRRRRGESDRSSIVSMSGWLFADMLLVLAIVALGAMLASKESVADYVASVSPSASPTPTSTSPSPSPSPSTSPKPKPTAAPGLNKDPSSFTLVFSTSRLLSRDPSTIANVREQIKRKTEGFKNRRAGFVLTFGGDGNSGTATRVAQIVNAQLVAVRPQLFKGAVLRDFINLSGNNQADVEVYLYR